MKKLFLAALFLLPALLGTAQADSSKKFVHISSKGDTLTADPSDTAFSKVEIESEFPGGDQAWQQFLQQNLYYPRKAARKRIQGTVVLQFIVCTDGTVCDIEAVSGPELLKKAAVDALKKTPNWRPALQFGRQVKSYKKQPIVFMVISK